MTRSQLHWLQDNARSHLISSLSAYLLVRVLSSCGSLVFDDVTWEICVWKMNFFFLSIWLKCESALEQTQNATI